MRHPNLIAPSRLYYKKGLNLKKEAWLSDKDRIAVKEYQAFYEK